MGFFFAGVLFRFYGENLMKTVKKRIDFYARVKIFRKKLNFMAYLMKFTGNFTKNPNIRIIFS
jgi:hypothetical protein